MSDAEGTGICIAGRRGTLIAKVTLAEEGTLSVDAGRIKRAVVGASHTLIDVQGAIRAFKPA